MPQNSSPSHFTIFKKNEALTEELFDAWETSSKSILIIVEKIGAILKQQLPLPPQPPSN